MKLGALILVMTALSGCTIQDFNLGLYGQVVHQGPPAVKPGASPMSLNIGVSGQVVHAK